MSIRKFTVPLVAAAVLFGLGACGSTIDGEAQPQAASTAPAPTPPAAEPDALPLPNTDPGELFNQAYLDTLAEEGIQLDKQDALDAAEVACDGAGLLDSINKVTAATGLSQDDAAYLVGAAMILCGVQ